LTCALLTGLALFVRWLSLRPVGVPLWFYVCAVLLAILLSILAGQMSPRRFGTRSQK
jgi:hypothetical protein